MAGMKRFIAYIYGYENAKKAGNKVKRWQAISESAAKQSKRSKIPEVHTVISFKEAVEYAKQQDMILDLPGSSCGEKSAGLKSICVVSMLRRRTAGFICFANRVIRWREA